MRAEISYDLVEEPEMSFEEGVYRLPGLDWQVFTVSRYDDVSEPEVKATKWRSGATGIHIRYPRSAILNRAVLQRIMSDALGISEFAVVKGPDFMLLR